jgi:hypothetical protein
VHLPVLAYHWRNIASSVSRAEGTLPRAVENGRRAVQEQCDRLGLDARVEHGAVAGCYRLVRSAIDRATVSVVVPTRLEGAAVRPYRLAVEATVRALSSERTNVRLLVAHPESVPAELLMLLDDVMPSAWQRVPVPGPWSIAAGLDRALLLHPADVLVSVAPGLRPRSDRTPDWLGALVGLAASPGAGLVGAMIANRDDTVLHAGWDIPNYRWYELEGLRVGSTTSGNDLLIERECSQVSLAAAAVSSGQWRECAHLAVGSFDDAGRALSQALVQRGARTLWTPHARLDR